MSGAVREGIGQLRGLRLLSNYKMPVLGLGTFMMHGDVASHAVDCGLAAGYRMIDTAVSYGNHAAIGQALRDRVGDGKLAREDVFVTTKIQPRRRGEGEVKREVEEMLSELQLRYIDLLLIHHPYDTQDTSTPPRDYASERPEYLNTWAGMEACVREGLVRSVGLSNFSGRQISRVLSLTSHPVSAVQSECHVYHQQPELRAYCRERGIALTGYGVLGARARPERHRADPRAPDPLRDGAVTQLSGALACSPAQLCLRFFIDQGVAVIPKSASEERIRENIELDFEVLPEHVKRLKSLNRNYRYFRFLSHEHHPEFEPHPHF